MDADVGMDVSQSNSTPLFVEIFAGKGAFSRAALQAGLRVVSIDHEVAQPLAPMVALDLTSKSGCDILWDILESPGVGAVHMGLPCGTSSRARELPIPQAMKQAGVPEPPPLRSAEFPMGLPNLAPHHQARVTSANILYALAVEIILWCFLRGIAVSVENPANSWLWAVLVWIAREHSAEAAKALNNLQMVLFHACCHGSTRRKHTGWLSTPGVFSKLQATCNNDHPHEPWGVRWRAGSWVFDTSSEAHYPRLLGQRATECLLQHFAAKGYQLTKPLRLHDKSVAVQGRQTKKHRPLVPEYYKIIQRPVDRQPPAGCKPLPPHFNGGVNREEDDITDDVGDFAAEFDVAGDNVAKGSTVLDSDAKGDCLADVVKYGVYHTPKQFLSRAHQVQHPMDSTDHLESVTKSALDFIFQYPTHVVKLERKKNLLQAKLMSVQLAGAERELHQALPPSLAKVLEGKQLLLWKGLLEKYGYDDMGVVPFMFEGVKLVGVQDAPPCYPPLLRPATLVAEDLQASAVWRRRAAIGRSMQADPTHVEHLETTAAEELQLGFLEGPFSTETEVTNYVGRDDWCVVRRFVLVQGAEMKLRPIDDCLEAQLNHAFTVTSYLKLQDIDYITGLALKIAERLTQKGAGPGIEPWLGKCLDLSKAYKQMAIHPSNRHLAVIFFYGQDGAPKFFVANSLMFGASAAVYSFNRVSRSLWFLLNKMLCIPCGVFYDDFPMFSPESQADDADAAASQLLDLLGWRHATTGTKALPFKPSFQVLGCSLNLEEICKGAILLENKPGRIDRLVELLMGIKSEGCLTKHQGQIIHGLMRYACGFFSGKFLHQVCVEVLALSSSQARKGRSEVASFCDYAIAMLRAAVPRRIDVRFEQRPILVFTDGSWEQNFAGIGAVLIDLASGEKLVCRGVVPDPLLQCWKSMVGEHVICQIELYVMVLVRLLFKDWLQNRRTIWWVDNDAARFCIIKGLSPSLTMKALIREFYAVDAEAPTYSWVERVPSSSNVADGPSRGDCREALEILGLNSVTNFEHPNELIERLT